MSQGISALLWMLLWLGFQTAYPVAASAGLAFEVTVPSNRLATAQTGRLFVLLSPTNSPEPRKRLGRSGPEAPLVWARDLNHFSAGSMARVDQHAFASGPQPLGLPPGDYCVQALFDVSSDLRSLNAPGNLFSPARTVHLEPGGEEALKLQLTEQIPPEQLPAETEHLKFLKMPSRLLSQFHGRPMFLRAGIVLPRDYQREPARRYPLWVRIGGLNTRYTVVTRLMAEQSEFRSTWLAEDTPRFILLQLDGAGPYGDPYYVNSANNGPYGEALVQELIPQVEAQFRAIGQPQARVLSGTSTGGWVALALQIFYPDAFNGAWASCPDPVDFRALELINIYADTNAYVNRYGQERPSERNASGDVVLTVRQEVGIENLLGRGNRYTLSGEQWGAWNAVFSPRAANGLPVPLWDPRSGSIDAAVAEHWKQYDLRRVLERDWTRLAPRLNGKLHIAAGEADQYFLNNAAHLLDQSLAHASPAFSGRIVYGPGKGHGWSDLSLRAQLEEMQQATQPP